QQQFDNAIKLRTVQNDATRVAIEQENANTARIKLQQDNSNAAVAAKNAMVTTPSGKTYVDGSGLDAAGKAAALNAGQVVLTGDNAKSMTTINNVQGQVGTLLTVLQGAGVIDSKGHFTNFNDTSGGQLAFANSAGPNAINTFTGNLKSIVTDLQKLPNTGSL